MGVVIKLIIQVILWVCAIGYAGYYSYNIISPDGGIVIQYMSMPKFLNSIGACDANGVCDLASVNGCFLCPYIQKLFFIIGQATEVLWEAIINYTWILLVIGLVIFMLWKAYQIIMEANKSNASLTDNGERKLEFSKWWDAVKGQAIRVLVICALLGAAGFGGAKTLQVTSNIIIYPTMIAGTSIAMAATGTGESATCRPQRHDRPNPMNAVSDLYLCIMGNLNAAILWGMATGFAIGDMAWAGMAGGIFTWLGGFLIVVAFIVIGLNLIFKMLNVVFSLAFLVIFAPLLLASYAFNETWSMAKGLSGGALKILAKTAVRSVGVVIEVLIISSMVNYTVRSVLSSNPEKEYKIMETCEAKATDQKTGKVKKNKFVRCFKVQRLLNPDAFNYEGHGWEFLTTMFFFFLVYKVVIHKKLEGILDTSDGDAYFKFGDSLKGFFKSVGSLPFKLLKKIPIGGK
jgi:hypothetical protein